MTRQHETRTLSRIVYSSAAEAAHGRDAFQELLLHQPADRAGGSAHARLRRRLHIVVGTAMLLGGGIGGVVLGVLAGARPAGIALAGVCYAVAWPLLATISGLYADDDARPWTSALRKSRGAIVLGLLVAWLALGALTVVGARHAPLAALAGTAAATVASIVGVGLAQAAVYRSHPRQRTVIIGSGAVASHVVERLEHAPHLAMEPIGLVDDDVHDARSPQLPRLGRLDDLEDVVRRHRVDRAIVAFTRSGHDELLRCIRVCWDNDVAIDIVPRLFEFLDGARAVDRVGGLPMLSITAPTLSRPARVLKRASDVVLSAVALVTASPLLLAVVVLIKLDSRGPAFFAQVRVGRGGRRFRIYKLRSMYLDAEARKRQYARLNDLEDGVMFKIHEDPRITRIGRILRRLSIDELPQLINVLRGDMSLVGPRPLIEEEAAAFDQPWHGRRLDLRPGLTGLWQIYGRSTIPFPDMLRFDYQYVANWSLARDFEIMLLTVPAVLSARGAF
ncbi:MAG: sugar transferase [Solirubrobacteraceae bacterium]